MQADRRYSTTEGTAHAAYDGSTWHVSAHPANGSGQADSVAFEAWRDAGFRGRDWRTGANTPDALGSANPTGNDDQWPSLKAIAEAAIHVAFRRVRLAALLQGLTVEGAPELVTSHPFSVHSRRPVCRVCKRSAGDHAMTEEGVSEASYWTRAQQAAGRVIHHEPGSLPYVVARDLPADDAEADAAIDLTPGNEEQANILTMLSEQFARQGMVPNAFGAMASVLDLARCLQANAPDVLQGVIDRLQQDEVNWGPDTPAGRAAALRAEER